MPIPAALKNRGLVGGDGEVIIARVFDRGLAGALNADLEIIAGQTRRV